MWIPETRQPRLGDPDHGQPVQVRLAVASPALRTSHVSSEGLNDMYTCYSIYMFDALYEMLPKPKAFSNVQYAMNGAVPTTLSANAKLR